MKFLIWVLCLFVFTILNELLGMAIGFKLGYLILYLVCSAVAKSLCKKWDEDKKQKEDGEEQKHTETVTLVLPDIPKVPDQQLDSVLMPNPLPQPDLPCHSQQNFLSEAIIVTETEKKELKDRAIVYLPRNLNQTEAQRQIIQMLATCVPSVRPCVDGAERDIWHQVESNLLPIGQAAARCGNEADKLIGITIIENLKLEEQSEENLLKAWIALDYYSYLLKKDYSVNIRKLQDRIAVVLKNKR